MRLSAWILALRLPILASLSACTEYGLDKDHGVVGGEPDIEVTPAALALHTLPGCDDAANVTITNRGVEVLTVSSVELDGDPGLTADPLSIAIAPGDRERVLVTFAPGDLGDYAATLTVSSDDPDHPAVEVPITGDTPLTVDQTDRFVQAQSDIDVLWVIDNSSSMAQEQARVSTAINSFFQYFSTLSLDYHMGVITTDVVNPLMAGRLQGSPTFITTATVDPAAELAEAINVGEEDMGDESGLYAAELGLSEPVLSTENAGFYRPDAHLAVIFLTDEPEQSGIPDTHFNEFFTLLKPDPGKLHLSAIAGDPATGCAATCDGIENTATPGDAYYNVVTAFGGVFYSICNCDIAPGLDRIGALSTAWLTTFALSAQPADPSRIAVTVDGLPDNAWYYDGDRNSVVFTTPPVEGAPVSISYPVETTCD